MMSKSNVVNYHQEAIHLSVFSAKLGSFEQGRVSVVLCRYVVVEWASPLEAEGPFPELSAEQRVKRQTGNKSPGGRGIGA